MDYGAWKIFIEAVEFGSLSKVAAAHGTSQPHISRQVGELEEQCGGRLFHRTGRGVVLTELGRRIAPKVRAWMANTDQLISDIQTTVGKPIGSVRLGILPSTAHPLVSTLYYRLKARYPLVQLSVREGQGAQLENWLANGSVDLALLYRHSPTPKDGDVYLAETATYLVGAHGDPLTIEPTTPFSALHNLPLVLFCRPNSWRDQLDLLAAEHGIVLNVAADADSLGLQMHIVADGGTYALLGPYASTSASKEYGLQASQIVNPILRRHIALAMSPHGELTLASRAVMQVVQEIAKSLPKLTESSASPHQGDANLGIPVLRRTE
jgi:LysR family nitrogen assimilation transcriptional regulator